LGPRLIIGQRDAGAGPRQLTRRNPASGLVSGYTANRILAVSRTPQEGVARDALQSDESAAQLLWLTQQRGAAPWRLTLLGRAAQSSDPTAWGGRPHSASLRGQFTPSQWGSRTQQLRVYRQRRRGFSSLVHLRYERSTVAQIQGGNRHAHEFTDAADLYAPIRVRNVGAWADATSPPVGASHNPRQ